MVPLLAAGAISKLSIGRKLLIATVIALVALAMIGTACYFVWQAGADSVRIKWEEERTREAAEAARRKGEAGKVTLKEVTKYVDRMRTVYKSGDTIIKEIPVYVTKQNDARCTVNDGFVSVWNLSNQGELPGPPGPADAAPSAVVLSDIATQHTRESTQCRAVEAQLIALEAWITKQCAIHDCYASE
jgi:hypothetical protein